MLLSNNFLNYGMRKHSRFNIYKSFNKFNPIPLGKKEIDQILGISKHKNIDFENAYKLSSKQKLILEVSNLSNQLLIAHGAKRTGKTKAMILASLKNIYEYSLLPKKQPAIFLVTAPTSSIASRIFLREVNDIFGQLKIDLTYNDIGHVSSCKIFDVVVSFVGLSRQDGYTKIKGETIVGWFGTEISTYNQDAFNATIDRISAGKKNIYLDVNPQSPSHWVYRKYIAPNRGNKLGEPFKVCLQHFNYLDSLGLFEGASDYWKLQEVIYKEKDARIDPEALEQLYSKLLTREFLEPHDKEAFDIIDKCGIGGTEIADKLGFWFFDQNEPLRHLMLLDSRRQVPRAEIQSQYSVAFLDLANTANEHSCYTALAIVWSIHGAFGQTFYFTGELFKKPYYETISDIHKILEYYNVDRFYYDLHGAGVGMKDLPEFKKYGGTGLLQTRNKASRIADLSLLINANMLYANTCCPEDFFHQVRSFRFTEKVDNAEVIKKVIKGFCDAPDALESAIRVYIKGAQHFNEDDNTLKHLVQSNSNRNR